MPQTPTTPRNRLLDSIKRSCALEGSIESVSFPVGHEIAVPGKPLRHFYFPTSGVLSALVQLQEGETAETLIIGSEGMVGLSVWLGLSTSLEHILQQAPGEILRIPARVFCKRIIGSRRTERLLKRFTAYSLRFGAQSAVCNSHHDVRQRACRWLLDMADRSNSDALNLTQSLLAHMLGVRRQSVSDLYAKLQRSELIRYGRSEIQILDRKRLEGLACECYREMRHLYEQLVSPAL